MYGYLNHAFSTLKSFFYWTASRSL